MHICCRYYTYIIHINHPLDYLKKSHQSPLHNFKEVSILCLIICCDSDSDDNDDDDDDQLRPNSLRNKT